MRSSRFVLSLVLLSLSVGAAAQSHAEKAVPQSDAQKAFEQVKALEGSWVGSVTTIPPVAEMAGAIPHVTMRVTSMGNALIHEIKSDGRPDDPITMLYLDDDRLLLTHYCDAGNRPRMVGKASPDGKTVEFDFLDIAGSTKYGHMNHAVFTTIDANHHTEDWTFVLAGDKSVRAHFDLQRAK